MCNEKTDQYSDSKEYKARMQGCNLLDVVEQACDTPDIRVEFSKKEKSTNLNQQVSNTGLKRMLKRTDYPSVHMVFPFVAECIGRATKCPKKPPTLCSFIRSVFVRKLVGRDGLCAIQEPEIEKSEGIWGTLMVFSGIFKMHCGFRLYMLNSYLLDTL